MADFNMDNLESILVDERKVGPGKQNAHVRALTDEFIFTAEMAANDEYLMNNIPEGAIIVDAYIKLPNVGATGIVEMGLKAHVLLDGSAEVEDSNSLVIAADGGGQDALKRSDLTSVALGKQIGKGGAQAFIKVTELSTAAIGVKMVAVIKYMMA